MKRFISVIALTLALVLTLAACGSKDDAADTVGGLETEGGTSDAPKASAGTLTREEWIGMLGDRFGYLAAFEETDYFSDVKSDNAYYNQIQACAEWGVLGDSDTFAPKTAATWSYVMETAVRAIGVDNINTSTAGVTVSEDALTEFFTGNIANVAVSDYNASPTGDEAEQVLNYAYQYYMTLTPADVYEVTYTDGVYEVPADAVTLKGDGVTAILNNGATYAVGDVIYVMPSDTSGAYALKVTAVNQGQISYELAGMEDVFEEMVIKGSQDVTVIGAEAADYVNVSMANPREYGPYGMSRCSALSFNGNAAPAVVQTGIDVNVNSGGVSFHTNLDGIDFTVELTNFKADTDVDFGLIKGLKSASATVSFQDTIRVDYQAEHVSKTIPLGKAMLQLGASPLQVEVSLVLNIGLDGEIHVSYTSQVVGKVQYQKGKDIVASVNNNDPKFNFNAKATVTAEPTVKVDLQCLSRSIANIKVTSGLVAVATVNVDIMETEQLACIDIYLYVPLRWAVNEDSCVMTSISSKLQYKKVVWNSENSGVTQRFHWENLELVDACTRGQKEQVETPVVAEDGQPYEEYKLFEFEEIVFGSIKVAATSVYLDKGETMALGILSVPDGYSVSDLIYTVQDTSVCNAQAGRVTGVEPGSTVLQISTPDGKYSVFVAVIVNAEYNDTSGFVPL